VNDGLGAVAGGRDSGVLEGGFRGLFLGFRGAGGLIGYSSSGHEVPFWQQRAARTSPRDGGLASAPAGNRANRRQPCRVASRGRESGGRGRRPEFVAGTTGRAASIGYEAGANRDSTTSVKTSRIIASTGQLPQPITAAGTGSQKLMRNVCEG